MPINKSLDCKHKVEALSLQDLTSSRLAFEKCDQWNWDFSDSPIQPKGWLLHRQEDRCLGKFHLARLVVASERKQSCAHTLTKSIEKCIFHSISNLMQTQELEKCHNHTSLGQNYSLREFLSCIRTKSKTPHGVCVWLGIPPTTGTCKMTFLSLKATPKSALCAHSALYTLYSFISHRGHQIISSQIVMFIMHQPERAKQLTWETVPWDLAAISFQAATPKSLTHLPGGLQTCAWRTRSHPLTEGQNKHILGTLSKAVNSDTWSAKQVRADSFWISPSTVRCSEIKSEWFKHREPSPK